MKDLQVTTTPPAIVEQQGHGGQIATLEIFALDANRILARKKMLQDVMESVMIEGTHYGVIPGCGKNPSLYKPGAEALSSTFQLCPRYLVTKTDMGNSHREYEVTCELYNPAGGFIGSGVGSATTMEGKYRFRKAEQKCPECGRESTIIKGKQQYGGGWICFAKKGGCGAKFNDGDPAIENQNMGRVEHDNPADYYNTVLKMGKKRAFVDAVLTATGASDIFTQDIEDMPEVIPNAAKAQSGAWAPPPMMDDVDVEQVRAEVRAITSMAALEKYWKDGSGLYTVSPAYKDIKAIFDERIASLSSPPQEPKSKPKGKAKDQTVTCPDTGATVRVAGECAACDPDKRAGCPEHW
jgi:hypothetical protein